MNLTKHQIDDMRASLGKGAQPFTKEATDSLCALAMKGLAAYAECSPPKAKPEDGLAQAEESRQVKCLHGIDESCANCDGVTPAYDTPTPSDWSAPPKGSEDRNSILPPLVIRTALSGLGKSVVITRNDAEVLAALRDCLAHGPSQVCIVERAHQRECQTFVNGNPEWPKGGQ